MVIEKTVMPNSTQNKRQAKLECLSAVCEYVPSSWFKVYHCGQLKVMLVCLALGWLLCKTLATFSPEDEDMSVAPLLPDIQQDGRCQNIDQAFDTSELARNADSYLHSSSAGV